MVTWCFNPWIPLAVSIGFRPVACKLCIATKLLDTAVGAKCSIHKSPNMAYMAKFKCSRSWWLFLNLWEIVVVATFWLPRGDAGYTLHGQRSFLRRSIWSKRHPYNLITKPLCPYRDLKRVGSTEPTIWSHICSLLHSSTSEHMLQMLVEAVEWWKASCIESKECIMKTDQQLEATVGLSKKSISVSQSVHG